MNRRVWRAAIIGTGRIASRLEKDARRQRPHTHAGWYRATPRTCLVAGTDVDAAALAAFQSNRSGHLPVARGQLDPRIRVVSL